MLLSNIHTLAEVQQTDSDKSEYLELERVRHGLTGRCCEPKFPLASKGKREFGSTLGLGGFLAVARRHRYARHGDK